MSVSCEIHWTEWDIPYPASCDAESVPGLLRPLTHVEHDLDAFPWHLAGQLIVHLEHPEACFEYLHLTKYCLARAAMLAIKGNVLDHSEVHAALGLHKVQVGGIYRKHFLRAIRSVLEKHNLVQMPECNVHPLERIQNPRQVEKNRDLLQAVIQAAELEYLNTLTFISVASEMEEEVSGHSVGFWVKGAEMPKAIKVRVRVKTHAIGHDLMPSRDEVKRLIRAKRPVHKILIRLQEELPLEGAEGGLPSTSSGPTQAKVIGDFNAIILPSGIKMLLTRKHKRRAFLRAAHLWCTKHHTATFFWQEIIENYNEQFRDPSQRNMQIASDRIDDDLFKGQKAEFDELFEVLDRMAGHLRLKVPFLVSKLGCWWFWLALAESLCDFALEAAVLIA